MQYQSEQISELMGALAKAQGKMQGAIKDSANPFFKSRYADLASVWNACRDALSENNLAVSQTVRERESGEMYLHTMLAHSSGQWTASTMPIRIKSDGKTNELQVLGSCLSYLRRYALAAIVGVAPSDDDDGNTANAYKAEPPPKPTLITINQINALRGLLSKCDNEYIEKIMSWLSSHKIMSLEAMPVSFFDPIMTRINKHLSDEQSEPSVIE
jgi:hypothetical protein